MAPTGSDCPAGAILYNSDSSVLQWCDGSDWIGFPKLGISGGWQSIRVELGDDTCGVLSGTGGVSVCWGGTHGATPVTVGTGYQWQTVEWDGGTGCGLRNDGLAMCWGGNAYGELGNDGQGSSDIPVFPSGGYDWLYIGASGNKSCGIRDDDVAMCWGNNLSGENGTNSNSVDYVPTAVAGGHAWQSLGLGNNNGCGVRTDGVAMCWGRGTEGQLGDGTTTAAQKTPITVSGGYTWESIDVGGQQACGIRSDAGNVGVAMCWGNGSSGQLGDGNTTNPQTTPVTVSGGYTWQSISTGSNHTCGIRDDAGNVGVAMCWGNGSSGQLGDGNTTNPQTTPVTVSGSHTWQTISAGTTHTCGIRTDGVAMCWGEGSAGELGDGNSTDSTTPVEVDITAFDGGGTGCLDPVGLPGAILYNSDHAVMQWCDGTTWYGFKMPSIDKTVFVTSTTYTGDLQTAGSGSDGIDGANNICNTRAAAGSLSGTYYAWITNTYGSGPASRFTLGGPLGRDFVYKLVGGTTIATGWADLVDAALLAAISLDEFGSSQTGNVWTNVDVSGEYVDNAQNCSGWTTSSGGSNRGGAGDSTATDSDWTDATNPQCNNSLRLYCFEQ